MTYSQAEGRQEVLDGLAEAIDALAFALACLGEAYELLDETSGDHLDEAVFRPVRTAYGRAKRTHSGFSQRHGLPERAFPEANAGVSPAGAPGFVELALGAVEEAELTLSSLQDTMLPVEVGDAELRSGLASVRESIAPVAADAREFSRTLGR